MKMTIWYLIAGVLTILVITNFLPPTWSVLFEIYKKKKKKQKREREDSRA